jgi:hypothetical protein
LGHSFGSRVSTNQRLSRIRLKHHDGTLPEVAFFLLAVFASFLSFPRRFFCDCYSFLSEQSGTFFLRSRGPGDLDFLEIGAIDYCKSVQLE